MAVTKAIRAASNVTLSDKAKNFLVFSGVAIGSYLLYKTVTLVSDVTSVVTDPLKNINKTFEEQKAAALQLKKKITDFEKTDDYKLAFSPDMWQGKTKEVIFISDENAKRFAKEIKESLSLVNDDEERIYGVYRNIVSKASMMKVAVYYYSFYKADLYQTLKSNLTDSEIAVIIDIVKSKKDFTKKSS